MMDGGIITAAVGGLLLAAWGVREWKKTKQTDGAIDQGLKIKDGSIKTLTEEIDLMAKLLKTTRNDQVLFVKQRREEIEASDAENTKWKNRVRQIERDRDILRKIVKDLVADIRKVKRADMPVAELNTGLIEDIDFFPGDPL